MYRPKAYDPFPGFKYQILVLCPGEREYEHCDWACNDSEKKEYIKEYRQAYGPGFQFKVITLPQKYWPKKKG